MVRFNQPRGPSATAQRRVNYEGVEQFAQTPELELISILLTSFVKDKFYRKASDELRRIRDLADEITKTDPYFVGRAAVYARREFHMRSISHIAMCEFARSSRGHPNIAHYVTAGIFRPDDAMEMLSAWKSLGYGKWPNAFINRRSDRGIAGALRKFDGYQLAKYRMADKSVSLIDVVNLCHPTPASNQAEAMQRLVADELRSDQTWESKLSAAGQRPKDAEKSVDEAKSEAWLDLLHGKLGYFALLRNLRNIMQQAPEALELALSQLVDSNRIKKSKVLPFRFDTAIRELVKEPGTQKILVALNQALNIACANVPKLKGRTLVAMDESGSMTDNPFRIGALFAAVLVRALGCDLISYSSYARYRNFNPQSLVGDIVRALHDDFVGASTSAASVLHLAMANNQYYDRVIYISDQQDWVPSSWVNNFERANAARMSYIRHFGKTPKIWSFDVSGYGSLQTPKPETYCVAGFSEKVFEVMGLLEQDRDALVNQVRNYDISRFCNIQTVPGDAKFSRRQ